MKNNLIKMLLSEKIKCLFGHHDDIPYATLIGTQQDIYKCRRCGRYRFFHYGIGCLGTWMEEIPSWCKYKMY